MGCYPGPRMLARHHQAYDVVGRESQPKPAYHLGPGPRCQRSLLLHCAHLQTHHGVDPFVQPCFLDLSQCVSRTPLGLGFVPCLTPKGKIWATHLHRFLSGEECALLMGLRAHEIPKVSGVFLKDLVGNSFCLPILVCLWLGILTKVTI